MTSSRVTLRIHSDKLAKQLESLFDDSTMTEIQTEFARIINPWTPYLSGDLSKDLTITPTGVTYNVPYSGIRYTGNVVTREEHPLATNQWDTVAMQSESDTLKASIREIVRKKAHK